MECAGGDHTQDEDVIYSAFELLGDEDPGEWVWMGEELNVKDGGVEKQGQKRDLEGIYNKGENIAGDVLCSFRFGSCGVYGNTTESLSAIHESADQVSI